MSQHHDKPKRKPWKEAHQMALSCGVLIILIFTGLWAADRFIPKAPLPAEPIKHYSLQEARR